MMLETNRDQLLCKVFQRGIIGAAMTWFDQLRPNSISSFYELSESLISQFIYNRKLKKIIINLMDMKQRLRETLKQSWRGSRLNLARSRTQRI